MKVNVDLYQAKDTNTVANALPKYIQNINEKKKIMYTMFFDFTKAFHNVNYKILLEKINKHER